MLFPNQCDFLSPGKYKNAYKNVSTVFVFTMKVNGVQTTLDSTDFHGID